MEMEEVCKEERRLRSGEGEQQKRSRLECFQLFSLGAEFCHLAVIILLSAEIRNNSFIGP